jgi:hypothetical protein
MEQMDAYRTVASDLFLPVVAVVVALSLLVAGIYAWVVKRRVSEIMSFSIAFGFLGGTAGVIAGASTEPIVGAFLTGLIGVLSALLSILFAKETLADHRDFIPPAITLLCLTALAGLTVGRVYLSEVRAAQLKLDQETAVNEQVYMPVAKRIQLHDLCIQRSTDAAKCDAILASAP